MEISKEKIIKNINSILAAVSIAMWFLPMFGINTRELGYDNSLTFSGFEMFVGIEFSDGTATPMNIPSLFLIVFPLMLILSNYVKQLEKWKRYYIFAAPAGSIIFLIITKFSVGSSVSVTVSTSVGFWLYLLLNIALLILAYFQFKGIELDKEQIQKFVQQSGAKFADASQNLLGTTCPNCGAKILQGKKFCPKCGGKLPEEEKPSDTKKCPECGADVPKTSKFCPECGQSVPDKKPEPESGLIKCQSCGSEISAGLKFCPECGAPVKKETPKCSKCGAQLKKGVKFCTECGAKVTGE